MPPILRMHPSENCSGLDMLCPYRQPSNYIIIVCNYSISSNDRSPPNCAVDKQALILPSTNRRFAIEFQAVRSCCSSAMPRSDPLHNGSSLFCFSNHLNVAWLFPSISSSIFLPLNRHRWRKWVGKTPPRRRGAAGGITSHHYRSVIFSARRFIITCIYIYI